MTLRTSTSSSTLSSSTGALRTLYQHGVPLVHLSGLGHQDRTTGADRSAAWTKHRVDHHGDSTSSEVKPKTGGFKMGTPEDPQTKGFTSISIACMYDTI